MSRVTAKLFDRNATVLVTLFETPNFDRRQHESDTNELAAMALFLFLFLLRVVSPQQDVLTTRNLYTRDPFLHQNLKN